MCELARNSVLMSGFPHQVYTQHPSVKYYHCRYYYYYYHH